MTFRSGFVAVVGRPNTGKSTLVNALVGTKVAITSDKPQTTRSAVRGILNEDGVQVVFVDTPGYHKPRNLLGQRLNEIVRAAWSDVDLCLFVVDGAAGIGRGDQKITSELTQLGRPVLLILNKIDVMAKSKVAAALATASALGDFDEFVPVSARTGEQIDVVRSLVVNRMPEGPMYYPEGTSVDQPPPIFVAEILREKLLARTHDEIPHSIAVVVEEYTERDDGLLEIEARVVVERESQKGIVIGRGGEILKGAGTEARLEIEALFGRPVFLRSRVKVEKDWQRREPALDRLGFE
ncbi:MAG: GTPase Era [Actinomycetota bacterium]|nr:GTPase Era [Actinomycetota bacterium]